MKVSLREIIFLVAGVLIGGGLLYIWEAPFFPQPVYPKDTFIVGKVTLAPICPVETMPSDPNCLPQPYKTTVQVTNSKAFQLFDATVETNDQGEFKVAIDDPYTYDVRVVGEKSLLTCTTETVGVNSGETKHIDLHCDTGIR